MFRLWRTLSTATSVCELPTPRTIIPWRSRLLTSVLLVKWVSSRILDQKWRTHSYMPLFTQGTAIDLTPGAFEKLNPEGLADGVLDITWKVIPCHIHLHLVQWTCIMRCHANSFPCSSRYYPFHHAESCHLSAYYIISIDTKAINSSHQPTCHLHGYKHTHQTRVVWSSTWMIYCFGG